MQEQRTLSSQETKIQGVSHFHITTVSLQRRHLCRPNSVLFMQKASQKNAGTQGCSSCYSIIHQAEKCTLIEVTLNLGHHFFFSRDSFSVIKYGLVEEKKAELHLADFLPIQKIYLYHFQ